MERLPDREAASLEQGRYDDKPRSGVQRAKLAVRDKAEEVHLVGDVQSRRQLTQFDCVICKQPAANERYDHTSISQRGQRLKQAGVVLVWPRSRGIKRELRR